MHYFKLLHLFVTNLNEMLLCIRPKLIHFVANPVYCIQKVVQEVIPTMSLIECYPKSIHNFQNEEMTNGCT